MIQHGDGSVEDGPAAAHVSNDKETDSLRCSGSPLSEQLVCEEVKPWSGDSGKASYNVVHKLLSSLR